MWNSSTCIHNNATKNNICLLFFFKKKREKERKKGVMFRKKVINLLVSEFWFDFEKENNWWECHFLKNK